VEGAVISKKVGSWRVEGRRCKEFDGENNFSLRKAPLLAGLFFFYLNI
jgi:hypothetical protein